MESTHYFFSMLLEMGGCFLYQFSKWLGIGFAIGIVGRVMGVL